MPRLPAAPRSPPDRAAGAAQLSFAAKTRLAGEILLSYVRLRWAMSHDDLPSIVDRIRARRPREEPPPRAVRAQLGAIVMRVLSVLPTDSRCLIRSLVLLSLLERRGADGTLVVGVRTEPDFLAHAWVECDGEALLPTGNGEFARLTVL